MSVYIIDHDQARIHETQFLVRAFRDHGQAALFVGTSAERGLLPPTMHMEAAAGRESFEAWRQC